MIVPHDKGFVIEEMLNPLPGYAFDKGIIPDVIVIVPINEPITKTRGENNNRQQKNQSGPKK